MTKTIVILAIAGAFVAGMLVSAPSVFAPGIATSPGPIGEILRAITELNVQGNDVGIAVGEINDKQDELAESVAEVAQICGDIVIGPFCGDGFVTPELGESCDPPDEGCDCNNEGCCTNQCQFLVC